MKKKFLAIILVLAMAICLLPATAFADTPPSLVLRGGGDSSESNLTVTLPTTQGYYTYGTTSADGRTMAQTASNVASVPENANWQWKVQKIDAVVDGTTYSYTMTMKDYKADTTLWLQSSAYYSNCIEFSYMNLRIMLEGASVIKAPKESDGVHKNGTAILVEESLSNKLLIDGSGSLTVSGHVGIFGVGDLTIAGGTIDAFGETFALGSNELNSGSIKINGGTVTATSPTSAIREDVPIVFGADMAVLGSENLNGSPAVPYNQADQNDYKYLRVVAGYSGNTPNTITENGVAATVTYSPASPWVPGAAVTATVTLTGTAMAAGTHTVNLTSAKASLAGTAQTSVVAVGQNLTATPVKMTFSFTVPTQDVDDIKLTHTFTANYSMDFTATTAQNWAGGKIPGREDCSGPGWDWKYQTKTLTLSGLDFTTAAKTAIELSSDTNLVLQGGTINNVKSGDTVNNSTGIECHGLLNISGSGTLNVTGGVGNMNSGTCNVSCGIISNGFTMSDGTVNATGGAVIGTKPAGGREMTNESYGLFSSSDIEITGGRLTATGGTATGNATTERSVSLCYSFGINCFKNIYITAGTVIATGGVATDGVSYNTSYGITASKTTNISGTANVTATAAAAGGGNMNKSIGIAGTANISGGTVTSKTTSTTGQNRAFYNAPTLIGYAAYQWRTASDGAFTTNGYIYSMTDLYLEIKPGFAFTDSSRYDVPTGGVGTAITAIDVSVGVAGGKAPYTFSLENAPAWLSIDSTTGIITGTRPIAAAAAATATVKVTDSASPANSKIITIAVGAVTEPTKYGIAPDAGSSWKKGSTGGLGFTADAELDKFTGVSVDGAAIGMDKFAPITDRMNITLLPDYLKTLTVGKHTLRINFTDGYAEIGFTVAADTVPSTGDGSMLWLWMGLAALAGVGLAASVVLSSRKRREQD